MSGYFFTLLVTSVCGTVCAMLSHGGYEKYIKYIASLVCITVMVLPFRSIDLSEITDNVTGFAELSVPVFDTPLYKTSAEMTEEQAEAYISEIVFGKFGINTVYTDIKIDWTKEDAVIECINIALSKSDMERELEIEDYLSRILGGEVTVVEG